jgi:hypothetical protein
VTAPSSTVGSRYIDALQATALVWLVISHSYAVVWLPLLFPALPVLFAVGGATVARVLEHSQVNPWPGLARLAWRVLPPVWALAAVIVPVMLALGWTADPTGGSGSPLAWGTMWLWLLPVAEPPGSEWGHGLGQPVGYIAAYLWLLLLSPSLLWLFRRWPLRTMSIPLLILVGATAGVLSLQDRAGRVVLTLAAVAGCWMLGFAHHDNTIRSLSWRRVLSLSFVLMASGVLWLLRDPAVGSDNEQVPLAIALWGMGAVLLLLRLSPGAGLLPRMAWLDEVLAVVTARTVTIYLWTHPAIYVAGSLVDRLPASLQLGDKPLLAAVQLHVVTLVLLAAVVLVLGPLEDFGGRHRRRRNSLPSTAVNTSLRVRSIQPPRHRGERGTAA